MIDFRELSLLFEIRNIFKKYDKRHSDRLNREEFVTMFNNTQAIVYIGKSNEDSNKIFKSMLEDLFKRDSDQISWIEFIENKRIYNALVGLIQSKGDESRNLDSDQLLKSRNEIKEKELMFREQELKILEREVSDKERMITYIMDSLKSREQNLEDKEVEFHHHSRINGKDATLDSPESVRDFHEVSHVSHKRETSTSQILSFFKKKEVDKDHSPSFEPIVKEPKKKSGSFSLSFLKRSEPDKFTLPSNFALTPIRKSDSSRNSTNKKV